MLADEVQHLQREHGASEREAILTLLDKAQCGDIRPELMVAMVEARDKRGRKSAKPNPLGLPSLQTLERILKKRREGKSQVPEPSAERDMTVLPWHAVAYEFFCRPQKPKYTQVAVAVKAAWQPEWGPKPPSATTVRRIFLEKFSSGDVAKGRNTGSALAQYQTFQPRSADGLLPFEFVCADGWNTHFRAPHPVTGEMVTYEIWHFHDVATRFVTPVSIGLTENTQVILKGIENCIRVGGRIRELLTDHTGSIKNNKVEFDPVNSVSARAGFTLKHPVKVGKSQVNGIAEKFNQYLDLEARDLASYQNPKVMDEGAWKKTGKFSAKMMKAIKAGNLTEAQQHKAQAEKHGMGLQFTSFEEAVVWINSKIDKYNRRPCEGLPAERNPATGRMENPTPLGKLQQFMAAGWKPLAMDEPSLADLFREHKKKRVVRGMVSPFNGQLYKHEDLWHYTRTDSNPGAEVLVVIDSMDWQRVGVKTLDGAWICEAEFVAATGYSTLTAQEHANEKLMNAQIKHKENGIERIRARMEPTTLELAAPPLLIAMAPLVPAVVTPPPVYQRTLLETYAWIEEEEKKRAASG